MNHYNFASCMLAFYFVGTSTAQSLCGAVPTIQNGVVDSGSSTVGSIRLIVCRQRFQIDGPNAIFCNCQARWTKPGTCVPSTSGCGDLPQVLNGVFEPGTSNWGDSRTLRCNAGFRLNGLPKITCVLNTGEWTQPGTCITQIPCQSFPTVVNGGTAESPMMGGSVRLVFCREGFSLVGSPTTTCRVDGTWSQPGSCIRDGAAESFAANPIVVAVTTAAPTGLRITARPVAVATTRLAVSSTLTRTAVVASTSRSPFRCDGFTCVANSTRCLRFSNQCDQQDNCGDNSDETDCDNASIPPDSRVVSQAELSLAATVGRFQTIRWLVQRGGLDLNAKLDAFGGLTALHIAVQSSNSIAHLRSAQVLLEGGANVDARDSQGWTPLIRTAIKGFTQNAAVLLDRRANIEARDPMTGWTALSFAVRNGHFDMARFLIQRGANKDGCADSFPDICGRYN